MDQDPDDLQNSSEPESDSLEAQNKACRHDQEDQSLSHQILLSRGPNENVTSRQDSVVEQERQETISFNSLDEEAPHEALIENATSLQFLWDHWVLEIMANCIAILALIAIVITLATHADRPLPNWPYRISINALVSVFAVILKGLMMFSVAEAVSQMKWLWYKYPHPLRDFSRFDDASRGPLGSAKLLLSLHGKHTTSLGAAITILAIATDPFVQQVIKYYPCRHSFDGPGASILRTNNYTIGGHYFCPHAYLDPPMRAALYQGVYRSYVDIQPTCVTGNCSFPDYRTVGVCHKCRDISSKIEAHYQHPEYSHHPDVWSLPSGLNISIAGETIKLNTYTGGGLYSDSGDYFTRTQIVSRTGNISQPIKVIAAECDLAPCVRTYNAEVLGGNTTETLLDTLTMSADRRGWPTFNAIPMPCLIDGTYYNASAFPAHSNDSHHIGVPGLLSYNTTGFVPDECVFAYYSSTCITQFLGYFLNGWAKYITESYQSEPDWVIQLYEGNDYGNNASLATIDARWAFIAGSMTAQIRRDGEAANSRPATGRTWKTETCVSVRWAFLMYPASLLGLSMAFLGAAIWKSARAVGSVGRLAWKGSPLAVLFHGMSDGLREECRSADRLDEMGRVAKKVKVKIEEELGGTRLIKA